MAISTSVFCVASKRPDTAIGRPEVVTAGWPSAETSCQSNMVSPAMRFAARSGSTAEATHMIEAPENTSSVTLSARIVGAED